MIRKTQISFMLLAIVMILVHTIIPHHHHKNIACFSSLDCYDEYYQHDNKKQEHHSKHCEGEQTEDCALQKMPTIVRNNVKQIITEYESFDNSSQDIKIDILKTDYSHTLFCKLRYFEISLESKHTFLINSSSGLRAPPLI